MLRTMRGAILLVLLVTACEQGSRPAASAPPEREPATAAPVEPVDPSGATPCPTSPPPWPEGDRPRLTGLFTLGDSILAGAQASSPERRVGALLRASYPGTITDASAGGRTLYFYAHDEARRAQLVARIASGKPSEVWLALGVNDYTAASWTAGAYGQAYARLVDDLRVVLPGSKIFCQSPLWRHDPTPPNRHGDTLADFREAARVACEGKPDVIHVDGLRLGCLGKADMADVVHLNDAGQARYATAIRTIIGW
jgi:lysophospholipase L1-like esterase